MIRILYRHRSGTLIQDLPQDQLAGAIKDPQSRIWVDLQATTPDETSSILVNFFHFHPLAVEDAIKDAHAPKVDDFGSYLYVVFHTFRLGAGRMDINAFEIDAFLGPNYLVTIHDEASETIDAVWDEGHHKERGLARGPAMLLYELLDRQVDRYIPILDQFETHIEELGDIIFHKEYDERAVLDDILTAKSSALRLHRILMPQRDLLNRLAHNDYSVVTAECRIYFQDVYDHVVRLSDLADSIRDLVATTTITHLTIINNRLNEVMKILTIISTIFMPLSFVAGIYGMNFEYMPELYWRWGYLFAWLIFLSIAGTMIYLFRRKKWF